MAVSEGLYQRMLKKIQKSESGCWLWAGATTNGYGTQALPGYGPNRRAHVLMYEHHFGPVSEGMVVCHKCNVKLCVRPAVVGRLNWRSSSELVEPTLG